MGRTFSAVPYTYLKRGVYYFVRRIRDLQTFYRTDRVILSLRTKSLHRASRASEATSRLDDYWLDLRLKQTDVPGSHLLRDHSSQTHKNTVKLGSTLSHASGQTNDVENCSSLTRIVQLGTQSNV